MGWDLGLGCNNDQLAFKGIFVRHLSYLLEIVDGASSDVSDSSDDSEDLAFIRSALHHNADSLWTKGACLPPSLTASVGASVEVPALFGFRFGGPCSQSQGGPTATSQTAALDVFTASLRDACRE